MVEELGLVVVEELAALVDERLKKEPTVWPVGGTAERQAGEALLDRRWEERPLLPRKISWQAGQVIRLAARSSSALGGSSRWADTK